MENTKNDSDRFADSGAILSDYARHFVVQCPKCQGKALINAASRLMCTACFHTEDPGRWYGAATIFTSVKCRECNHPIRRRADWDGHSKNLATRCEHCGDSCIYEAHISKTNIHAGLMTDPVFGLPLWLQDTFRNELFWAFNYEHLAYLRSYVAARLRERGVASGSKNSRLVSRLPEFVKKAANRAKLLKLIDELQLKS